MARSLDVSSRSNQRPSPGAGPSGRGGPGLASLIKDSADIVQIVGERVALTPAGANFKGLCPFHAEKTPSFMVNPSRRIYHCFGCNAGGSVVDFVMAFERLEFPEAVRVLAERLGIDPGQGRGGPRHEGLKALDLARSYYRDNLIKRPESEAARQYLKSRSLDETAWQAFGYYKVATSADAGASYTASWTGSAKGTFTIADYSGVDSAAPLAGGTLEPFANDIRLRDLAPARLRFNVRHQRFRQSYGKSFHVVIVLRLCRSCKTTARENQGGWHTRHRYEGGVRNSLPCPCGPRRF